jgi:hypothetical protein
VTRNHSAPFEARPTVYKGIEMRSRLEAEWAAHLDDPENGWGRWEYEPCAYANERGQYLPDFRLWENDQLVFLEVKGWLGDPQPIMRNMEIVLDSEPTALLMLMVGHPMDVPADADWSGTVEEVEGHRWVIWFSQSGLHNHHLDIVRATPLDGQRHLRLPRCMSLRKPYSFIEDPA